MQALIKGETQVDQASRDGSGAVRVRTLILALGKDYYCCRSSSLAPALPRHASDVLRIRCCP